MNLASYAYRFITRRFSTLFLALTVGAISTDLIIDKGGDYLFNQVFILIILIYLLQPALRCTEFEDGE